MLALFDEHEARSLVHDPARGLDQIGLLGQLAGFAVIDRDQIDVAKQFNEFRTPRFDPEVHRVAGNKARLVHLLEHLQLQARIDVGEKDERRVAELFGDLGAEIGEHAEVCLECLSRIEIVPVAPPPAKTRTGGLLESREVNAARGEWCEFLHGVVVTHNTDELHGCKVRRRRRKESAGTTEHVISPAERGFDGIEGY